MNKPLLIVISGPSGVGKDAVLNKMKELHYPMHFTVTATTRPIRQRETDGIDYLFISQSEFQQMQNNNELLEWAQVYGNYYGIPKEQIKQAFDKGLDVIVKIDVQGAATIKKIIPDALFIMIAPPSMEKLEERLRQRKTESAVDLKLRTDIALEEMKSLPMFDYVVVNEQDQIGRVVSQIKSIIIAEKCRVKSREIEL